MKTINLQATITATSTKIDKRYPTSNPRKTIYFSMNEENIAKAIDFGLTKYTSKDNNDDFFIVKASEGIAHYNLNGEQVGVISGKADDGSYNFTTPEEVTLAIMEGEKQGNKFYRVYALMGAIEEVKPENPFHEETKDITF